MASELDTVIVGMGPHGRRLLRVVANLSQLRLVGIVDRSVDALAEIDLDPGLKFRGLDDFFGVSHADVILIATNGPSHAEIAMTAMQKGARYLLVEKPMACSILECDQMLDLARQVGARIAVDKINRYDEMSMMLRDKAVSGEWGELRSVYIQKPGIGLGCLGTHSFDQANFFFRRGPEFVTAWVDPAIGVNPRGRQFRDPGGLVILDYGGPKAIISQIEDGAGPQTLEMHFTGARVYHDPKNMMIDIRIRDLTTKPGPGRPPKYITYDPPPDVAIKADILEQIRLVISDLISDRPMLVDGKYGRDAIEILVAAYVSHELGNVPVSLPLEQDEHKKITLPIT